jgi:hypothetical protein
MGQPCSHLGTRLQFKRPLEVPNGPRRFADLPENERQVVVRFRQFGIDRDGTLPMLAGPVIGRRLVKRQAEIRMRRGIVRTELDDPQVMLRSLRMAPLRLVPRRQSVMRRNAAGIEMHGELIAVRGILVFATPLVQLAHSKMSFSQFVLQIDRVLQKRLGRLELARLQEYDGLLQRFPRTVTLRSIERCRALPLPALVRDTAAQQPSKQADQHDISRNT